MSTRSTTHFVGFDKVQAIIYRHADGYPEGAGTDIYRFLADVESQTKDTRFNDPSYLAAKYVVWLAREFASTYEYSGEVDAIREVSHADERPLDFLSVGVVKEDPFDIEYRYVINCDHLDADGYPKVECFELYDGPKLVAIPLPGNGSSN